MNIQSVSLKDYTSLRIGGEADLVKITNDEELLEALTYAENKGLRVCVLGEGTNTFFSENLEGVLVIKMEMKAISEEHNGDQVLLKAYAGVLWDELVSYATESGLWGIENLSRIPGTVGAAPIQNIGAYGVELKDVLVKVRAYSMDEKRFIELPNDVCEFAYRDSLFKKNPGKYIVTSITLEVSKLPKPVLTYTPLDLLKTVPHLTSAMVRDAVIDIRTKKLPDYRTYPNAGSFFKNPSMEKKNVEKLKETFPELAFHEHNNVCKVSAAWLIEHIAHMKGERRGDVGTWPVQPLVIVNYGQSTSAQLLEFSGTIQKAIFDATGITLEREVNFV